MDGQLFEVLGKIAGIGGLSIGLILVVFKAVLDSKRIASLPGMYAYRLLRLTIVLAFLMGVGGLGAWVYVSGIPRPLPGPVANSIRVELPDYLGGRVDASVLNTVLSHAPGSRQSALELTVSVAQSTYHVGDTLTGMYQNSGDCYCVLLHRDANGVYTVLPAHDNASSVLPAGKHVFPPSDLTIRVTEPVGTEELILLGSPRPVRLGDNEAQQTASTAFGRARYEVRK